jgi:hypothetical protein
MIKDIKALYEARDVHRVVLVDDAFDISPRQGDVDDALWDRFFDDLNDKDETEISAKYGQELYHATDASELRRDQRFVDIVWGQKDASPSTQMLFSDFERVVAQKRGQLAPLISLLEKDLGLSCDCYGRDGGENLPSADIIFLDLYLGQIEDDVAVTRAISRIKEVVDQRRSTPPTVILLSQSPNISEVGPQVRDNAELLGCQFRMIKKDHLIDSTKMVEKLYELETSHADAMKINNFLLAWDKALTVAKREFLRSIRTLDLADYTNVSSLILDAEGEPLGDYILDLYDLHLHNTLEGDSGLIQTARSMNDIRWSEYPPAQFMPSPEVIKMLEGTVFHNEVRTNVETAEGEPETARLGDVYLESELPVGKDGNASFRACYVVISQACDLQHRDADRILLLKGSLRPYTPDQAAKKSTVLRTPLITTNQGRFVMEWDLLAPETWMIADIPKKKEEGLSKIRRFRSPFALQIQQAFLGRLGRVGTMVALPGRYPVAVKVFLQDKNSNARLLAQATDEDEKAVSLIGRSEKGTPIEWLLLSESLQDEIRDGLLAVDAALLPGGAAGLAAARSNSMFYRALKQGLNIQRDSAKGTKPFKDTEYDVLQILTQSTLVNGGDVDKSLKPVIIEVHYSIH